MPDNTLRVATMGDESPLDAFLAQHADSSLFLRSYLARGGVIDEGKPLQGTYALALADGRIVGVAMHTWNNIVFLQAPESAADVIRLAVATTGRPVKGIGGPWSQVETALADLGVSESDLDRRSREDLFALSLASLIDPSTGELLTYRRAEGGDLDLLREWRFGYEVECTGLPRTDATRSFAAQMIEGHVDRQEAFLLERDGTPVSLCTHNARVLGTVQIGGVWTPPELRGRGYARKVVAGALHAARQEGVTRAVLFTENAAARRAYEALGFRRIDEYGVAVFREQPRVEVA